MGDLWFHAFIGTDFEIFVDSIVEIFQQFS